MCNLVKRLMTDESGVSATEYAILLAVVGGAVATAMVVFLRRRFKHHVPLLSPSHMTTWVT